MERLKRKHFTGYMLGDLGCGIVFGLGSNYLLLYYTDVLGITAAAAAMIFLIARIWDAVNDPMMGSFIDYRRRTGKSKGYRGYIYHGSVPLAIFAVLMFVKIPGISMSMNVAIAALTYIIFGMLYTWVNIPYGSLASVMTNNKEDRSKLSTFRTLGSLIGGIVMGVVAMPIITGFDSMGTGFIVLASVAGIIALIFLKVSARNALEQVKISDNSKITIRDTLNVIVGNRPYITLAIISLLGLLLTLYLLSLSVYLFLYYFNSPNLYSIFSLAFVLSMMIPVPVASKLAARFGKKKMMSFAGISSGLIYFILFLMPLHSPFAYIGMVFLANMFMATGSLLIYAMVADTIDYAEWKSGTRQDGVLYAVYSFFRKLGQAGAGWLSGMVLVWIGFKAGEVQTPETLESMKTLLTLFPAIFAVLQGAITLVFYNLPKDRVELIQRELEERRSTLQKMPPTTQSKNNPALDCP